jgi:hypothetical protein
MIDQSNRAGKLNINGSEDLDGPNLLCLPPSSTPVPKRYTHSKRIRAVSQNEKKLHRRATYSKITMTSSSSAAAATVTSRQSPLSYSTKGKSI